MGNDTRYGTVCECPVHYLLIILLSYVTAPMLMSIYGTWKNIIKIKTPVSLPSLTQTGLKDSSWWQQFLLGKTEQRYGPVLNWQRCVIYTWPVIIIMTNIYSEFLVLWLYLVSFCLSNTAIETLLNISHLIKWPHVTVHSIIHYLWHPVSSYAMWIVLPNTLYHIDGGPHLSDSCRTLWAIEHRL